MSRATGARAALGVLAIATSLAGCSSSTASVGQFTSGQETTSSAGPGPATAASASGSIGDADTMSEPPTDDGLKLDVSAQFDVGGGCEDAPCLGCGAVDLLFVVDNSAGMAPYQAALGEAFEAFATALFAGLPGNTSVHVGVTSTTMGHSATAMLDGCMATGDEMQPADAFYVTPLDNDTGVAGAQGRLVIAAGRPYYEASTSDPPDELVAWFREAVALGGSGSAVGMSAAAAGWAADPINAPTNDGFIRDAGAALLVFVLQAQPDQTPAAAADELLATLTAAKQACGGMVCVVAGGFVDTGCAAQTPLGVFLDAAGDRVVQQLPAFGEPSTAVAFEQVMRDTIAPTIIRRCDQVPSR